MSPAFSIPIGISALAICVALAFVRRSRSLPFPPGPRPDPLLGNVRQMAGSDDVEVIFERWGKEHGEYHFG